MFKLKYSNRVFN